MAAPDRSRLSRPLGAIVQAVAALAVLVVLLAAIELTAGFFLDPEPAKHAKTSGGKDYVGDVLTVLDVAPDLNPTPLVVDPLLLWRNKPRARKTQPVNPAHYGHPQTWTIETDSHGFRGPEVSVRRAADAYRVLLVGDSITFGFNVDQGDTFASRLPAELARIHPGRRFEVIDAAVPGWTWAQGQHFVEIDGLALRPDVIVIGHGTNDRFFPATVTDLERLPSMHGLGRTLAEARHVLLYTNAYRALLRLTGPPVPAPGASPGCRLQIERTRMCRRMAPSDIEAAVHALGTLTAAHGIDLILLNVDFMGTDAVASTKTTAARDGLPLVDFVERFAALRDAAAAARAQALGLAAAATTAAAGGPRRVTFRVHAPEASPPMSARGDGVGAVFAFDASLVDDGTHDDEVAGDGVYTGTLDVPPTVPRLTYKFFTGDVPELRPLPPLPSSEGVRDLTVAGHVRTPVARFGELDLMAERTHPDAAGHAVIAAELATEIARTPSFARFVGSGS